MAKLYTRTGDDGTTGLFDASRVTKDHPRVCAYGDVDELNAHLGVLRASLQSCPLGDRGDSIRGQLQQIQSELFSLGAELATPESASAGRKERVPSITPEHCARLESLIDEAAMGSPPLKSFVLPGGHAVAAQLHVCRTVCRRAERAVVHLMSVEKTACEQGLIYLNRLSDLFFAWAREVNHVSGVGDVPWVNPRRADGGAA